MRPTPLPEELATEFHTSAARELGVSKQRLRANDLARPFRGVRVRAAAPGQSSSSINIYAQARDRELALIRALSTGLHAGQFFTHRSAALLWEAPLPHRSAPELHVGVVTPQRAPRIAGVTGHEIDPARVSLAECEGIPLTTPAHTFAMLGRLQLTPLVAIGDHFARMHRAGYGRRDVGKPPLATLAELSEVVGLGRWPGMPRLRRALELVREDSWSPRESATRVVLMMAGLPEPELNIDVFDRHGRFLGCIDLAYSRYKVGIEYQGEQHSERFAEDVEHLERLRADGWQMIQVTKTLSRRPTVLVSRVVAALRSQGWRDALQPVPAAIRQ